MTRNCGFEKSTIWWVCVEGLTGLNIKEKVTNVPWYEGKTLFETLDSVPRIKRSTKHMIRLPILSKFESMG